MANNLDITTNDFDNICRTCLSRKDLNPLYEKYLLEMLMSCTVIKFAENDGFPAKICATCINEINRAFLFAKRCETTDNILRTCVIKLETEVVTNSSLEEPAIIDGADREVLGNYVCIEKVKVEENIKMELVENVLEVELNTKLEIEHDETYDDPVGENIEVEEDSEVQNEKCDKPGFRNKRRCTLIEKKCSKDDDPERYEEDDNQDKGQDDCSSWIKQKTIKSQINDDKGIEESHPSDSRPKRSCTISQMAKNSSKDDDSESYDDPVDDGQYSQSSNRIYECETCEKSFNRFDLLKRHQRRYFAMLKSCARKKKPHICEVCSYGFKHKRHLINHMRIHTGEKPYTCDVCGTSFNRDINLQHHMRIHTGEKPYTCEICSNNFGLNSDLKRHMRIHTGEMPYACEICSKSFRHNITLKTHMRTHTNDSPFTCKICSKKLTRAATLRNHMRIHTGEKPYTCKVCNKAFSHYTTLQSHMGRHTHLLYQGSPT